MRMVAGMSISPNQMNTVSQRAPAPSPITQRHKSVVSTQPTAPPAWPVVAIRAALWLPANAALNACRNPHTVHDVTADNWTRPYTRAEGFFPAGSPRQDKYWSPVGRIDNVYGDRNLVCACVPIEDYADDAA